MSSEHGATPSTDAGPGAGAGPRTDAEPAEAPGSTSPEHDPAAASRRLVAVLLLVVSLGAIGLVALGAAADRGAGVVYVGETEVEREVQPPPNDYSEPDWATGEAPTRPPASEGASTSLLVVLIVIGALLLALAIWVAHRMRKLARPGPALAGLPDEDELTAEQAIAALEDARTRLSTVVDAHDAVIAAWLTLERAIAEAGVRRAPSQTTLEFVVAVLGALDLDRSALDRLAHLYRRALFDPQPLIESDREEALALLDGLTAGLREVGERPGGTR